MKLKHHKNLYLSFLCKKNKNKNLLLSKIDHSLSMNFEESYTHLYVINNNMTLISIDFQCVSPIWMELRQGFPGGSDGRICLQCGTSGFDTWVGNIPRRREWQPTPVFLPGESHGLRSPAGYSLCGSRVRHNWATDIFAFNTRQEPQPDWCLWTWLALSPAQNR